MATPPRFDIIDVDDGSDRSCSPTETALEDSNAPLQPLSLNERNDRLRLHLSRSRSQNPNRNHEPLRQAVRLEGRRRLCKAVGRDGGEADDQNDDENIRDILDDLSCRLESLSVEKPKERLGKKAAPEPVKCVIVDEDSGYNSAISSCSNSSPDDVNEVINRPGGIEGPVISCSDVPSCSLGATEIKIKNGEGVTTNGNGSSSVYFSSRVDKGYNDKSIKVESHGNTLLNSFKSYEVNKSKIGKKQEHSTLGEAKQMKKQERSRSGCGNTSAYSTLLAMSGLDEVQQSNTGDGVKGGTEKFASLSSSILSSDEVIGCGKAVGKNCLDESDEELDGYKHDYVADDRVDLNNETFFPGKDIRVGDLTLEGAGMQKLKVYRLAGKIAKMLYPHQQEGLRWLWALHCRGTGGILGDDMGLGKTMQISAYLAGLFDSLLIKRALIVAPKTLLAHWMKELTVVGLSQKIRDYSGTNANARNYELQDTLKNGGILLTTYDIVRNNYKSIRSSWYIDSDGDEEGILWDYVILDEGHIIKNPKTQRAQSLYEIPSSHRIVISGTPIQNNLKEMWALFNFCCPEVLGDKNEFKVRYEIPILRGNDKNASNREKHLGSTVAKELRERIKPYFLRRLKSDAFGDGGLNEKAKLSKKNEMIVWLKLTPCQRQLYEAFLNSEMVHSSIQGSPLAALTILKKICDHPLLLTKRAAEGVLEGMDNMLNENEIGMVERMAMSLAHMSQDDNALQIDQEVSCKISFIMSLLRHLIREGHKVLIFSQTRKMLNFIQEAIVSEGLNYLRIDGTTKISEREKTVKDFQERSAAPIFLLTSQVGGLGLTLTMADRVIVVDPAWNPSTDNQSVDRAYRIGQTKDVIVYRLMTCGTIEEKIYKMQVFKGALFKTATEQKEQTRYFSKKDIQELFRLPEQGFDVSLTQQQLHEEHGQHILDEGLAKHIEFLESQGIAGVSHHSLLFSKTAVLPTLQNDEVESHAKSTMYWHPTSRTSSDSVVGGANYAMKLNDVSFKSRAYPRAYSDKGGQESPEELKGRIGRLSHTLDDKALMSKLPDSGEKIRRQIAELERRLAAHAASPSADRSSPDVISVDDLTEEMQNVLRV